MSASGEVGARGRLRLVVVVLHARARVAHERAGHRVPIGAAPAAGHRRQVRAPGHLAVAVPARKRLAHLDDADRAEACAEHVAALADPVEGRLQPLRIGGRHGHVVLEHERRRVAVREVALVHKVPHAEPHLAQPSPLLRRPHGRVAARPLVRLRLLEHRVDAARVHVNEQPLVLVAQAPRCRQVGEEHIERALARNDVHFQGVRRVDRRPIAQSLHTLWLPLSPPHHLGPRVPG